MPSDEMELREDRLADAYKDYLTNSGNEMLINKIVYLLKEEVDKSGRIILDNLERNQITEMIQSRDFTGKHDPGFEDIRNGIK